MPAISKKDILNNDVKKAFEELNTTIKLTVDQLVLLTEQGVKMQQSLSGKSINDLTSAQREYNIVSNAAHEEQKQLIEIETARKNLLKAEQEAILAKAKAEKMATDETKKAVKEAEKQTAATAKQASAFAKFSKEVTEARNKAKDAAIQYGVNSKEAQKLTAEYNKLNKKLNDVNESMGQHQHKVGQYERAMGGLKNAIGALGLAMGGAQLAQAAFNKTIESSQSAGDAWAITLGGINGAVSKFFSMLGTGDFSNFIENLKTASEAGRELARAMDKMFERDLSVDLAESQANLEISIQEKIRNDVNKTKEARIAAAIEINNIEERLAVTKANREGKAYEAFAGYLEAQTKLTREQLVNFITNFDEMEAMEESIAAKRDAAKTQTQGKFSGGAAVQQQAEAISKIMAATLTDAEKVYLEFTKKYAGASDEMIKDVIESYKKLLDVETEKNDRTLRNNTKLNNFIKDINGEIVKDEQSSADKKAEIVKANIEKILEFEEEIPVTTKKVNEEVERQLTEREQAELDAILAVRDARRKEFEDHIALEEKRTEMVKELQKEALYNGLELTKEIGSAIFESKVENLNDETEAVSIEYDKRLANEQLSEEQRSQLEAQRDAKKNEIERKKRELEKKAFIFNQAMRLADVAVNTAVRLTEIPFLLYPAVAPFVIGNGIAQAAIIAAQTIPKFDEGTDSAPETFWAGEKRPEIMVKNGKTTLIDRPTLFSGDEFKGSQIISGAETANILQNKTMSEIMSSPKKDKSNDIQLLIALNKINKSIRSNKSTTSVRVMADVKASKWYKSIRN